MSQPLNASNVTTLDLSFNNIDSLKELAPLSKLPRLNHLSLRNNPLTSLSIQFGISFDSLQRLDLTGTYLQDMNVLNNVPGIFPSLTWLQTKDTPLSRIHSATLLTIGHLPDLASLNHVKVSAEERQNAEIFYRNAIAKELEGASDEVEEARILDTHPRWEELCRAHGTPEIQKSKGHAVDPNTLEARTTTFTFYISSSAHREAREEYEGRKEIVNLKNDMVNKKHQHVPPTDDNPNSTGSTAGLDDVKAAETEKRSFENKSRADVLSPDDILEKSAAIPLTTSTYFLQGVVGRLFSLPPPFTTTIRLFYETDEWDPVAATDGADDGGWSVSEEDDDDDEDGDENDDREGWKVRKKEKGKMVRRTEELIGSTKPVGDWVTAKKARVKVVLV